MSLQDSETIAIATAAHAAGRGLPSTAAIVWSAERIAFVARSLRLRVGSRILLLGGEGISAARALAETTGVLPTVCTPYTVRVEEMTRTHCQRLLTSQARLPFSDATFDALAEPGGCAALTVEDDRESVAILGEFARVLRPGGRCLVGGVRLHPEGFAASPDKRLLEEWRLEGPRLLHHAVRLARGDGSWRRLHERLQLRRFEQVQRLLLQAGFSVLNAFYDYDRRKQSIDPDAGAILLCERD